MSVPAVFVGAWQRRSIAVGDGPAAEPADVIWLQTRPGPFADIRVNRATGAPVACFAGTTSWHAPNLSWTHELDLAPIGRPDNGTVTWRDGDLIETGEVELGDGSVVPYVEVWHRLPPTAGGAAAGTETPETGCERAEGRLRIRVGGHEISLEDGRPRRSTFAAGYSRHGRLTLAIDTRRVPPTVDPLTGATRTGATRTGATLTAGLPEAGR